MVCWVLLCWGLRAGHAGACQRGNTLTMCALHFLWLWLHAQPHSMVGVVAGAHLWVRLLGVSHLRHVPGAVAALSADVARGCAASCSDWACAADGAFQQLPMRKPLHVVGGMRCYASVLS
jgi:hypothetical protein